MAKIEPIKIDFGKNLGGKNPAGHYFCFYRKFTLALFSRSVVTVENQKFSSSVLEKNKRYSEQAAALVALHCLDIQKFKPPSNNNVADGVLR